MGDIKLFWGVWIPKVGWLKKNGDIIAFDTREVAEQTRRRIRQGAQVFYIDNALGDLEYYFLELEQQRAQRSIIRRLANFLRSKWSK